MTIDEIEKYVTEMVEKSQGESTINLRRIGDNPRKDAQFLMRLYENFPDETPESSYSTVIIGGKKWRVSVVEDWIRLERVTMAPPQKKSREEYQKWWAAELARRNIPMRVPEGQTRPSYAPQSYAEDTDLDDDED